MSRSDDDFQREQETARLLADAMPSELDTAAGCQFDIYQNWRRAGFSDRQALWLVGCAMTGVSVPPEDPE